MRSFFSKLNKEMKWGTFLLFGYLIWSLLWFLFKIIFPLFKNQNFSILPDIKSELLPPFVNGHILGTDHFGRSFFQILSEGLNYSMSVALMVGLLSLFFGTIVGHWSVEGNKHLSKGLDFFTNLVFIFPSILIAILFMAFLGQSFWGLVCVLTFTGWPTYAKIARGETLRIKNLDFVEGSRALGASKMRIFFKVVIPNILPVMLPHFVLGISGVIISEATLGFLGLGGSEYSWGAQLSQGRHVILEAPYLVIITSALMGGLILGLNLLGDGLRDFLDPQKFYKKVEGGANE